jgi:hypothetical protein
MPCACCLSLSGGARGDRPWRGGERAQAWCHDDGHIPQRAEVKKEKGPGRAWRVYTADPYDVHAQWRRRSADVSFVGLNFGEAFCVLRPLGYFMHAVFCFLFF